jgi:hypothetical protein
LKIKNPPVEKCQKLATALDVFIDSLKNDYFRLKKKKSIKLGKCQGGLDALKTEEESKGTRE